MKLGDEMNGFVAQETCRTLDEAAAFLNREARKHFPEWVFSLGKIEHERRQAIRLESEKGKWK